MTENDTFAARLAQTRAEKGLSQSDLAELTGIAPAQISRYESGRNVPRPGIVAKLATALSVSFGWLTTGQIPWGDELGPELRIRLPDQIHAQIGEAADQAGHSVADEVVARVTASLDQQTQQALLTSLAHLNVKLAEQEVLLHERQLDLAALSIHLRHACERLAEFVPKNDTELATYLQEARRYELDLEKFRSVINSKFRTLELRQNELFKAERSPYVLPSKKS